MAKKPAPKTTGYTVAARTPSGRIKSYKDATGKIVSARQYRQQRAGGLTGEQITQIRKAGKVRTTQKAIKRGEQFNKLLKTYQQREAEETGRKRSQAEILADKKFWRATENLGAKRSKSTSGKRAKALEEFGLRPRHAPWKVGESPKKGGK